MQVKLYRPGSEKKIEKLKTKITDQNQPKKYKVHHLNYNYHLYFVKSRVAFPVHIIQQSLIPKPVHQQNSCKSTKTSQLHKYLSVSLM